MRTSQSRQNLYVDQKRKSLKFVVGDHMLFRVVFLLQVLGEQSH